MRIGLVFDIREDYGLEASDVTFCDFNYLSDMQYLQNTLEQSGHYVLPVGAPHSFARMLREDKLKDIDIIMNFGEGFLSRNREGIVPALCEIFHLPYTGSDAFAMEKAWEYIRRRGSFISRSFTRWTNWRLSPPRPGSHILWW